MDALIAWIHSNPIWFAALLTGLHHAFDAAVDSLPEPRPMSSPLYAFAFTFVNKFAGNYQKK